MDLSTLDHLPIAARRDDIVAAIGNQQVLVIAGDTGSGKTTQLPKMCIAAGRGRTGIIGCTQPRRIAAVSVAERVAAEMQAPGRVGYKIRFRDQTTADTLIKFMTDGVLLAETRQDHLLRRYDTLIIDEAHERSLNIDFLLGYLKTLLARRPDLKLLISSATLDTDKFSAHFDSAPIINVSGRTYPVTVAYQPLPGSKDEEETSHVEQAAREAALLAEQHPVGDMLIFLPTERDILDCTELLQAKFADSTIVLPLFGRLHAADQRKIFRPSRLRKVIVATNIAETSLTVPGIRFVIDTGLARISRYNPRAGTTSLPVCRISRASCDQRTGRCGRTGPGFCLRLYSEEDYQNRPQFTQPEIQRANLAEVILQMISLKLGDPRDFPFLDPPSSHALRDGYRLLQELGAITESNQLTHRGRIMAGLPLDPCIARIMVEAAQRGAVREIKIIAAGLSIQDPRIRPADREEKADAAHRRFADQHSDFLSLVNIWEAFQATAGKVTKNRLRKFCASHFLSWQRMREWLDIHEQINELTRHHQSFHDSAEPASFAAIHQALLSGFLRNIGQKKEKNLYQISGGREVMLFPGSALFNHGGQWLVCASFMETGRLYAMNAASINCRWLEEIGGSLCRRNWSDPHWEKKAGQVTALEKVTLFGLVIIAGRRVNFGRVSESAAVEARTIFIRQALVQGELGGRCPFLLHNLALIKQYQEMEAKTRRRDILVDDHALYRFYDERLGQVFDRHTLNREIRRRHGERFLRMRMEDICQSVPDSDELYRFPEYLQAGPHSLPLAYLFEPGSEADGVTVFVPLALVDTLQPNLFEWLVPGLLEEKIASLLKSLPKALRRRLVPLPEAASRIMDGLALHQGSLYAALEQAVFKSFQMKIERTDWQPDKLPVHLKMRYCLTGEDGKTVVTSRSFQDLVDAVHGKEGGPAASVRKTATPSPAARIIETWDFATPPEPIPLHGNHLTAGILYPALFVDELRRRVELRYIDDRVESCRRNRTGLRFLHTLRFPKEVKVLSAECKAALASHSASWLALGTGLAAAELREHLLAFLLDHLFATHRGSLPSSLEFEVTAATAQAQGVSRTGRQMLDSLLRLLALRREVQSRLLPGRQEKGTNLPELLRIEMQGLLQELLPPHFLLTRQFTDLAHTERYLKALAIRIERAAHAPGKDSKKAEQIARALNRLNRFQENINLPAECCRSLAEYRELVEELRVSVFAPELGTAVPVSAKRLQQKWQEVENFCLRVE
ncbi:MAG TPA: ATP-dependent RNA helicase HrpA [Desulfobulbaceae bacterium]|nr:ATP-dependent RNA helicase HrpA [Desulfobulbaceae bacterium]